jgi:cytochrome P450 monooxygenase
VVGRLDPLLRELRDQGPVVRVRTQTNDPAWLVTRHAELKELLLDDRLENAHPDPANRPRYLDNPMFDLNILGTETAAARKNHMQFRSALTPLFSARRMAGLREGIANRVDALLGELVEKGSPADMHRDFSTPLSHSVLCDLLGVPDEEKYMSILLGASTVGDVRGAHSAKDSLFAYLAEVIAFRRATPGPDVISSLCQNGFPNEAIVGLVAMTSFPFLVTPSNQSVGIALLAMNPDQRALLVAKPELLDGAVNEILRMGRVTEAMLPRYAGSDIEIGGVTIRAGDLVLCDHYAPGFDDRVFEDPERFDITRTPNPHLAFSHGISHCIGAPLARIQLSEAYSRLLARIPHFRLDVAEDAIPMVTDTEKEKLGGGVASLPIAW